MSTPKMLVVSLTKTNAVLGAVTRRTPGAPPVADLVGDALLARTGEIETAVAVSADELSVTEVDYAADVLRQPQAYILDASGTATLASQKVSVISGSNTAVSVKVTAPPPADKAVVVIIDGGPNQHPLTFTAKTVLNADTTAVPVSNVPPGSYVVLASVDGYAIKLDDLSFS